MRPAPDFLTLPKRQSPASAPHRLRQTPVSHLPVCPLGPRLKLRPRRAGRQRECLPSAGGGPGGRRGAREAHV